MNHNFLRFQEIVRCGSIRSAADRLFVTPSALSREIAKLEESLGTMLFERHTRGMVLTAAGQIYLDHVRDVLHGFDRMRSELDALQDLRRGHVSLLSVEGYAPDFLAPAIGQFQERYPHLRFTVRITGTHEVVAGIGSGEADIGLAFHLQPTDGIQSVLRLHAPLLAVMAPGHPLANTKSLTLAALTKHRLGVPDTNFGVRKLIDLQSHIANVHLEPALEANSLSVLRGFAREGGGVTVLSGMSIRNEIATGQLIGIPLEDPLLNEGGIDICVLAGRKLPVAAAGFLAYLVEAGQAQSTPNTA